MRACECICVDACVQCICVDDVDACVYSVFVWIVYLCG